MRDRAGWPGKRALDMLLGGTVLVLCTPVLAALAVLVRRDGGPVFYRSERVGLEGRVFRMTKFRTMVVGADRVGPPSTADDDPRITRLGHRLRRWKLDELPQLLDVIRGDMSLVGPRPEIPTEVGRYCERERRLLSVRPGVTDYASIVFRNEGAILRGSRDPHATYRERIRPEKIELGLEYVREASLKTDMRIIGLTLLALVDHGRAMGLVRARFLERAGG